MKPTIVVVSILFGIISLPIPTLAENLEQISQLLSTKQCSGCDLSSAGLVMADLAGAKLQGANLTQANLSQANLKGADLSGANLSGTSLYGANLIGANLTGANLTGTDLRSAYLINTNLTGVRLDSAYVQGAIGIPAYAGTPELFYSWGLADAQRGNFKAALVHYNQALNLNPDFAPAYLARAIAYYRLGNDNQATDDAQIAANLFEAQNNPTGYEASQNLIKGIELVRNAENEENNSKGSPFLSIIQGIGAILLQFLLL